MLILSPFIHANPSYVGFNAFDHLMDSIGPVVERKIFPIRNPHAEIHVFRAVAKVALFVPALIYAIATAPVAVYFGWDCKRVEYRYSKAGEYFGVQAFSNIMNSFGNVQKKKCEVSWTHLKIGVNINYSVLFKKLFCLPFATGYACVTYPISLFFAPRKIFVINVKDCLSSAFYTVTHELVFVWPIRLYHKIEFLKQHAR